MSARSVTDESFQAEVLEAGKPVLVDFWAEWCGPCRKLSPILDELAADHAGKIDVVKLNVDESPAIAGKYGITSIPAVYLFKGGEVVSTVIGAKPKQYFEQEFAEYLK